MLSLSSLDSDPTATNQLCHVDNDVIAIKWVKDLSAW